MLYMALIMCLVIKEVNAQSVTFNFTDGIEEGSFKTKVEKNLSLFLTNINKASRQSAQRVDLSDVQMTAQAKESFDELWEFLPFKCTDDTNVLPCIKTVTGYNVRGIPVNVTDKETKNTSGHELTIGFNSNSQITSVYFALEQHLINSVIKPGDASRDDVMKKQEILNLVEQYRSFYDQKDIKSIEDIFTADAIIISGTVRTEKTNDGETQKKVDYKQLNKQEYVDNLRRIFQKKSSVKVKYNRIEVIAHPTRQDIYMVRLHQNMQTEGYEDNGYVTLLLHFPKDGGVPKIMVSTWQEASTVKSKDDLFKITDFKIY